MSVPWRPACLAGRQAAALALVLFLAAPGCVYYNTFHNALKRYEQADQKRLETQVALARGSRAVEPYMELYMEVIRKASFVLDRYPKSKWVDDSLLLIGKAYYWRGEYDEALLKFQELQKNFPGSPLLAEALYWQGLAFRATGRTEEARSSLKAVREGSRGSLLAGQAGLALSELEAEADQHAAAIEAYERLLGQPGMGGRLKAGAWMGIGDARLALGAYAEALQAYRKAIDAGPDARTVYQIRLKIGTALERGGKLEEALQVYGALFKAKRYASYRPEILLRQANVYRLMGRLETAQETYQGVIDRNPRTDFSAEAYYQMGLIEQQDRKDSEKAKDLFDKARREKSTSPAAELAEQRREVLLDMERYQKAAAKEGEEALASLFNLAEIYLFRLSEPDSALAVYRRALAAAPDSSEYAPKALYAIGLIYADSLRDTSAARQTFQRLVDAYPVSPYTVEVRQRFFQAAADDSLALARFLEAEALRAGGAAEEDVLALLKGLAQEFPRSPEAPKALYAVAWAYENRVGDLDTARAYYQLLVDRYPMTEFSRVATDKLKGKFLSAAPPETKADSAGVAPEEAAPQGAQERPDSVRAGAEVPTGPAPGPSSEGPMNAEEVEEKPVLVEKAPAEIPEEARGDGVTGTVVVNLRIDVDGKVVEAQVVSGPEALHEAARGTALKYRFHPARHRGRPQEVWMELPISFGTQGD